MTIYVISHNGGPDGHSPPLLAIHDLETARVALGFVRASGNSCYELFEVPEWPQPPNKWWDTQPIEPEKSK